MPALSLPEGLSLLLSQEQRNTVRARSTEWVRDFIDFQDTPRSKRMKNKSASAISMESDKT
jgi:hypothetical protein